MATDQSPPRVGLIAVLGIGTLVSLVGLKFVLDSYFTYMAEDAAHDKLAAPEQLTKLRMQEDKNLTSSALPISAAMTQLAQGRAESGGPSLIEPKASDDTGAMTGWSQMPRKFTIPVAAPKKVELTRAEIARKAIKEGGEVNFGDIAFDGNTAKIDTAKKESEAALKELVELSNTCAELRFSIAGHASREGDPVANKKLTLERAEAVKKYLTEKGVDAKKIQRAQGLGTDQPLVTVPEANSPEAKTMDPVKLAELHAKNRRISIVVATRCP